MKKQLVTIYSKCKGGVVNHPPYKEIWFSDGAVNTVFDLESIKGCVELSIYVSTRDSVSDTLNVLTSLANSISNQSKFESYQDLELGFIFSYLPNARADRVFEKGAANGLHIIYDKVNNIAKEIFLKVTGSEGVLKRKITSFDVHNEVAVRSTFCDFDEVNLISQSNLASQMFGIRGYNLLVAPDEGASGKCSNLGHKINRPILQIKKSRDPVSGKITGFDFPNVGDDIKGKKVIIVDDICDGGGTFLPIAEFLKKSGAAKVGLYVTHGIFKNGLAPFRGFIDELLVYQIIGNYITDQDLLTYNG